VILLTAFLLFSGCSRSADDGVLKIADQFGLAYAPLVVIKERSMLEEKGLVVEWVQLGNASAIREAMLAGDLDVGFMGIPPYLIGRDKGMEWQVFTGLTSAKLGLVSNLETIESIEDIEEHHRIVVPQPGSIQHILLSMAAEHTLGDPAAFDMQLVSMKHPDGLQALRAKGDIQMHFTSPPYVNMALVEEGFRLVLDGEEAFGGPFTFIIGVASKSMVEKGQGLEILQETLIDAIAWMQNNPSEAVELLSAYYDLSEEDTKEYLLGEQLRFSTEIEGLEKFESFMSEAGYLSRIEEK
jgi:NitT/TauT family transport system substrate-binding protein